MKTNTLIIIVLVLLILSTWWTHYLLSNSWNNLSKNEIKGLVKEAVLDVEYTKVWWKNNFEKINKLQIAQINKALWQTNNQQGQNNNKPTENKQPTINNQANWNTISQAQIKEIKKWTYLLWNKNAEITFIEYSDLECPFCKRLHQAGTVDQILKHYNGKVNFIFKQFPLYFHPQAQMEAEAAECVWELWWKDKYYSFITKTFNNSQSNGRSYTIDTISALAWTIWVDKSKVKKCIKSWKYTQIVKDQEQEWANLFKVNWTPGNVLLNNKTGKWVLISGAYPYQAFKSKIDNLLNK